MDVVFWYGKGLVSASKPYLSHRWVSLLQERSHYASAGIDMLCFSGNTALDAIYNNYGHWPYRELGARLLVDDDDQSYASARYFGDAEHEVVRLCR